MKLIDTLDSHGKVLSAPLAGYPTVQYTGASIEEAVKDAEVQTKALLAYYEASLPDVLFPFMDLSVEAEALGLPVRFKEDDGPDVTAHPVETPEDLERFSVPAVPDSGRYGVYIETVGALKRQTDAMVGAYVASPFTLAGLMMSAERLAMNTLLEPEFCSRAVDFSADVCIPYARELERAGADFIVLLEPTAALLSPELYEKFVGPNVQKVVDSLSLPAVLHVCGRTSGLIPSFIKNSVQGLSLDSDVDLAETAGTIPGDVVIIGNISPVDVMLNEDSDGVYRSTRRLLGQMEGRNNYVASTGCDVPPASDPANLSAFNEAVRDHNGETGQGKRLRGNEL